MQTLLGFFKESDGSPSSQRLIYILGSLYAMAMGAWVFAVSKDFTALIAVVTSVSGVFCAGKLIQKQMENQPDGTK